jgi:ABC-2 type transport system ATP-binding protein
LVGPNGAGKSTLLNLAVGLLAPSQGTIDTLGRRPATNAKQLARVGFVAQDTPTYPGLSIGDHLKLGARMNSTWDDQLAKSRIKLLGLDPRQRAGKLSGGQRAQLGGPFKLTFNGSCNLVTTVTNVTGAARELATTCAPNGAELLHTSE